MTGSGGVLCWLGDCLTGEPEPLREDCLRKAGLPPLVGLTGEWYWTRGGSGGAFVRSIANVEWVGGAKLGET